MEPPAPLAPGQEMRLCPRCAAETIHVPLGDAMICLRCHVLDEQAAKDRAETLAREKANRFRLPWYVKLASALVLLAAPMGFIHCVCSGGVPATVCWKESWGLRDTFVDVDDYTGKPLISLLPKAEVVRALHSCGAIKFASDDEPDAGVVADEPRGPIRRQEILAEPPAFYCQDPLCWRTAAECLDFTKSIAQYDPEPCTPQAHAACYDVTGDIESCYTTDAACRKAQDANPQPCETK